MVRLSTLAPLTQGVAAYAALSQAADTARSNGDPRSRGQLMTDTLIERVTGQTHPNNINIEIELIITSDSLFTHPTSSNDHTDQHPNHDDTADDTNHDDMDRDDDTDERRHGPRRRRRLRRRRR